LLKITQLLTEVLGSRAGVHCYQARACRVPRSLSDGQGGAAQTLSALLTLRQSSAGPQGLAQEKYVSLCWVSLQGSR
jgi:hypothetical protein